MAVQDSATLKGYFNTGDVPTESQFADLIDSTINTGLQATLVSGTNIKTINSTSLLGSGDIAISGGGTTITQQTTPPTTPSTGDLWLDTDATSSYLSGGTMLVAESVVSGSAVTSVTFTGLDGNAHGGYVLDATAIDGSNSAATLFFFCDTGDGTVSTTQTDYNCIYCGWETNVAGGTLNSPHFGGYSTGGTRCTVIADILMNNSQVHYFARSYRGSNGSSYNIAGRRTTTATNLTKITIQSSATNGLGIGSTFRLYRRK